MDRREVLKGALGFSAVLAESFYLPYAAAAGPSKDPRQFGARGDGSTNDTPAMQRAVDSCEQAGGGTVTVSPGNYLVGMIVLKSNITFSLQAGATLLASPNSADYGVAALSAKLGTNPGKHVIFAYEAENVALVGEGTIDGQGLRTLVQISPAPEKPEDLWKDTLGSHWEQTNGRGPMVEFAKCRNVRVEGVTLQNSTGWDLRPIECDTVMIRGIRIRNPLKATYTDGIDVTSSQNVQIMDCDIATGDDAISIKTMNKYGGNKPCRNVTISNCKLSTAWSGFKIGQESDGQFSNITMSNCTIYNLPETPVNERAAGGIVVEMVRHGSLDGFVVSNIIMHNVRAPIFVRLQDTPENKGQGPSGPMQGSLRNVTISNLRADGAIVTSSISGIPSFPVQNVTLENIDIQTSEPGQEKWARNEPEDLPNAHPKAWMWGRLPAYGLYCRHVEGLTLSNVTISSLTRDPRPMLVCEDVDGLKITGVNGTPPAPGEAFLDLRGTRDVSVHGCSAPAGTATFASVTGADSGQISFADNTLNGAAVKVGPDVPQGAVSGVKGARR